VSVPYDPHGHEDDEPITGLDPMGVIRWVWKFLVRHDIVHAPPGEYPVDIQRIIGQLHPGTMRIRVGLVRSGHKGEETAWRVSRIAIIGPIPEQLFVIAGYCIPCMIISFNPS